MSKQKSDKKGASKTGLRPAKRTQDCTETEREIKKHCAAPLRAWLQSRGTRVRLTRHGVESPAGQKIWAAEVVTALPRRSLVSLTDSTKTPSEGDVTVVLREVTAASYTQTPTV
eukprot:187639-Amphidinium_carterae.1